MHIYSYYIAKYPLNNNVKAVSVISKIATLDSLL